MIVPVSSIVFLHHTELSKQSMIKFVTLVTIHQKETMQNNTLYPIAIVMHICTDLSIQFRC